MGQVRSEHGLDHAFTIGSGSFHPRTPGRWIIAGKQQWAIAKASGARSGRSSAPECPDSDASTIEKVKQAYPLPAMDTLTLTYEQTPAGPIKVHQQIRRNGKIKRGPVATPFGVLARLRLVDRGIA
jgi:hypothetical protein